MADTLTGVWIDAAVAFVVIPGVLAGAAGFAWLFGKAVAEREVRQWQRQRDALNHYDGEDC